VSQDGVTPLHEAALNGHTQIAAFLIEKGASINSLTQGIRAFFLSFFLRFIVVFYIYLFPFHELVYSWIGSKEYPASLCF
jgi:hypothetical protein